MWRVILDQSVSIVEWGWGSNSSYKLVKYSEGEVYVQNKYLIIKIMKIRDHTADVSRSALHFAIVKCLPHFFLLLLCSL